MMLHIAGRCRHRDQAGDATKSLQDLTPGIRVAQYGGVNSVVARRPAN